MVLHVLNGLLARPAEMVQSRVDHQPRGAHELVAEVAEQVGALGAVRLGLLKKPNSRASSKQSKQSKQSVYIVEGPPVASRAIASRAIASRAIVSGAI